jgi:cytochrome P450
LGAAQPLLTGAPVIGSKDGLDSPPGPRGLALFKLLDGIRRDRIAVVSALRRDYGPVAQIVLGPVRLVIVSDAALAREVLRDASTFSDKGLGLHEARYFLGDGLLTASSGPSWSEPRTALAGAFRRQRVDEFLGVTAAATGDALAAILRESAGGKPVDFQPLMARIAFRTIEQAVLGGHSAARADAIIADCETLSRWVEARFLMPIDALTKLIWLMSPRVRRAARRFAGYCAPSSTAAIPDVMRERGLVPDDRLGDQMRTLLMAGFETTAAALCWTLDLLSRHPDWANRAANEARAHFGEGGGTDVAPLAVTRVVVKEALRLYPPVWALPRRAATTAMLGPWRIERDAQVLINMHGIHRDAATWPQPDNFDPGRFLGQGADPPGYMPFGIGARQCIGLHVAQAETVYVVARLMAALRIAPARNETPALAGLTLRPRYGLWLKVTPRHS